MHCLRMIQNHITSKSFAVAVDAMEIAREVRKTNWQSWDESRVLNLWVLYFKVHYESLKECFQFVIIEHDFVNKSVQN
jgi:hypothetical protein